MLLPCAFEPMLVIMLSCSTLCMSVLRVAHVATLHFRPAGISLGHRQSCCTGAA